MRQTSSIPLSHSTHATDRSLSSCHVELNPKLLIAILHSPDNNCIWERYIITCMQADVANAKFQPSRASSVNHACGKLIIGVKEFSFDLAFLIDGDFPSPHTV
jgi:hypothetical protein